MNWEAVSAISGILAAIAVMLTVVYLAIQVRKNTLAWLDPFVAFFIEGDGIGIDITPVMMTVVDAAVAKAYDGARSIKWMEIYSGEKSLELYGEDEWLPTETLDAMREFVVGIKGPMTTPVGGGIRSLNVATVRPALPRRS